MENKERKKMSIKKKIIIGTVAAVCLSVIVGVIILSQTVKLSFEKNHKNANEDVKYITLKHTLENGESRIFFISEEEKIKDFISNMPELSCNPSIYYSLVEDEQEKEKVSLLFVYNTRNDKNQITNKSIGMYYELENTDDDKWICRYDTNNSNYAVGGFLSAYKLKSSAISDYVTEYIENNTCIMDMDKLKNIVSQNDGKMSVQRLGMYQYADIVSDSGRNFNIKTDLSKGTAGEKMIIKVDDDHELYVFYGLNIGDSMYEYYTSGIVLYNKNSQEYINLMEDTDIDSFLLGQTN
ncbi:MAG: hypothetical protein E7266_06445 [Lachnospiraceae bacterium]|nr:hypothetical protein [Lachnospiraceae bacterium]